MRKRRFISWLLTICLLLGMVPVTAYAEGNTTTTTISGNDTDENTGTMTITLEIPKKTPAATDLTYAAPSDLAYSGSDKAATVEAASGVTGMGTITVKYYSDASRTAEATPRNVGTYYVGAAVAEGDQYAASASVLYDNSWMFEITTSTPSAPAAPTKASATKNSITLNAVSGCEYSKDGTNWQSGTEFTGLTPGMEYTFYQRVKATANTNASATSSASFSTEADTYAMTITLVIKPAQTITADDVTATYGDTDKKVSASVTNPTEGGGAITYAVKDGSRDYIKVASDGKLTIQKVPADGKAYIIVTAAGTDDYAETTKEVTVTISKAEVAVTAKNQSIYIGGTVPTLEGADFYTVTGLVGEDALTTAPTLAYQKDGSAATPDNTTSGTYDIVASGASAGDNYTVSYANGTLTISEKGTQTITAEDVTATYGDTDKKVSASVTNPTEGGAITYAVKSGSEEYISVDATTGALTINKVPADGKAYVTVTAAGTATYEQATKDVTVTINKADPTVTAPTAKTLTYTGSAQELVNAGSTNDGELRYAVTTENTAPTDENLYTTSIPTATNAGTYYVWYKAIGDSSHVDSTPACVTVSVAKKTATVKADAKSKTYGDADPALTATVTGTVGTDSMNYILSRAEGQNADEYVITVTLGENPNYEVTATNGTFTITKATITGVTATTVTATYDGQAHGITVNGAPEGTTVTFGTSEDAVTQTASPTFVNAADEAYKVYYKVSGANYEDLTGSVTVKINRRPVVVSGINANDKDYDEKMDAVLDYTYVNFENIVDADKGKLTVTATGAFEDEKIGNGKTVNITGITLGGEAASNYVLAAEGQQATATADICELSTGGSDDGTIVTKVKDFEAEVPEVTGLTEELAKTLCTPAEQAAYEAGEKIEIDLEIDKAGAAAMDAAVELVTNTLQTQKGVTLNGAKYLDISLYKKVGNNAPAKITDLNGSPITIKLVIPEDMRNKYSGKIRTFYIVRVHDGVAQVLAETTANEISFSSDLFSIYAICYKDATKPAPSNTTTSTPTQATTVVVAPKTSGESASEKLLVLLGSAAAVVALVTGVYTFRRRKEEDEA